MVATAVRPLIVIIMIASTLVGIPGEAAGQPRANVTTPESAAVFYSQLEAEGRFAELYTYMHPDAQAIIPQAAVVGWYQDNFAPLGPGVITVTDVQWLVWTWPVTGASYRHTAEVFFTQPFADGTVNSDVVRLVDHEGEWRWFFGRSRDFVDEQIALYGGQSATSGAGSCDGAAEWWAETNGRIGAAQYRAFTLPSIWNGGYGSVEMLQEYADGFDALLREQEATTPPSAAQVLHDEFVSFLNRYEFAARTLADLAAGRGNPLLNTALLANVATAMDEGQAQILTMDAHIDVFLATCEPLVVFVPGMGEDLPTPVFPGEVGATVPKVECWLFEGEPARAQRFFDTAGPGDPHGLDPDGDGVACEPGE